MGVQGFSGALTRVLSNLPVPVAGVDPYDPKAEAPHEMVSFTGSFHGRTLGALALTYKDAYKIPFSPGVPGARMVTYLDLDAAAAVIQKVKAPPTLLTREH